MIISLHKFPGQFIQSESFQLKFQCSRQSRCL